MNATRLQLENVVLEALKKDCFLKAKFRLVLVRDNPSKNRWWIYFGQIILLKKNHNEPPGLIVYEDDYTQVLDFYGTISDVQNLMTQIGGKPEYFVNGPYSDLNIASNPQLVEEKRLVGYDLRRRRALDFPVTEIPVHLEEQKEHASNKNMVEFESLNGMIVQMLGVNLDSNQGFRNKLLFEFETGRGGFREVNFKGYLLEHALPIRIKIDFEKENAKDYKVKIFTQDWFGERIERECEISEDLEVHIPTEAVWPVELRLIYKRELVDKSVINPQVESDLDTLSANSAISSKHYRTKKKDVSKDEQSSMAKELEGKKGLVKHVQSDLDMPKSILDTELIENKLREAEAKVESDSKAAIQEIAEAMEMLCEDYCKSFSIDTKKKSGIGLHNKVTGHFMSAGGDVSDLDYQTGVRHILKMCNLKKHKRHILHKEEAAYLLLCAWRGYSELLTLIKDGQTRKDTKILSTAIQEKGLKSGEESNVNPEVKEKSQAF